MCMWTTPLLGLTRDMKHIANIRKGVCIAARLRACVNGLTTFLRRPFMNYDRKTAGFPHLNPSEYLPNVNLRRGAVETWTLSLSLTDYFYLPSYSDITLGT